ncbi:glycosyltransferase family 2 protein, partial [Sphingomonas bacterium]|uniref:glycosyltransferase family 2 protein n=1 Tax=Sphingomonas bacterium TaxID=1895847 RepID=UPI0015758505
DAGATASAGPFGTVTVRWPAPDPAPPVTILVPTRDHPELLRACVGSVLEHTRYGNYTLVIIDNGSVEPETHAYLDGIAADPRVAVLPCPMPYNYSAINNFAVRHARDGYLCFLNNDTQVTAGDWLGEMMRYAVRPAIGAVGAKLLYEDGSIQHAGVVMGLGNAAGHAHRGLRAGDPGYFAQAHAAHYASAVTGACLVVEKAKFDAVGGFDAEGLQIAYNDVDLCLKLGRAGWRNVYAPQATLFHLESKSRGADLSSAHIDRYMRELEVLQTRWGTTTVVDPMHHPGLDRASETYRFRL